MVGLSKSEAETIIERRLFTRIKSEDTSKAIGEVISGVALAIEENNKAIESKINSIIDERISKITRRL